MTVGFQVHALETSNIHSRGCYITFNVRQPQVVEYKHRHCIQSFMIQNGISTQNHRILSKKQTIITKGTTIIKKKTEPREAS
jgi:hypothetical protein